MKEIRGDLFTTPCDALCITTNGYVTKAGKAVMGRGCALQIAKMKPDIKDILGNLILLNGNHVYPLCTANKKTRAIVSFPVKPRERRVVKPTDVVTHMRDRLPVGSIAPGWAVTASTSLIQRSAYELIELTEVMGWKNVLLPRPGTGAGELQWSTVAPLLADILDDRFTCITF